jgi:hypothetical protein
MRVDERKLQVTAGKADLGVALDDAGPAGAVGEYEKVRVLARRR